jgi:hypothetical protein
MARLKLYILAFQALRQATAEDQDQNGTYISLEPGLIVEYSQERAEAKCLEIALTNFPESQGFYGHHVRAVEVEPKFIREFINLMNGGAFEVDEEIDLEDIQEVVM